MERRNRGDIVDFVSNDVVLGVQILCAIRKLELGETATAPAGKLPIAVLNYRPPHSLPNQAENDSVFRDASAIPTDQEAISRSRLLPVLFEFK